MRRLGVAVATYGADEWTKRAQVAAASARAQDYQAMEVLTHHEPGGTLATARNNAARKLADNGCDWLCFLDADDTLADGFAEAIYEKWATLSPGHPRQSRLMFTPAVSYVHSGRGGRPYIWPQMPLRDGNWLIIATVISTLLFQEAGGFREWPVYEDWCLWQRCELAGGQPVEVPDAVYRATVRARSRNRAPGRREKERVHHEIRRANYPHLYEQEGAARG